MTAADWTNALTRSFGLRLAGDAIEEVDAQGNRIVDDTFLMLLNAHHEPLPFVLPAHQRGVRWELVFDTRAPDGQRRHRPQRPGSAYEMESRSLTLFVARNGGRHADGHPAATAPSGRPRHPVIRR